jgi:uncharacterized protein (DUF1499 family)
VDALFLFDNSLLNEDTIKSLSRRHHNMAGFANWIEMKRYAVYKTTAAPLSRTVGSIGLTLALIAYFAKRFGLIEADVFVLSLTAASIIALASIGLALIAFRRIWTNGGPGIGSALWGVGFGLLALVPPALVLGMLAKYPGDNDLSTDRNDPPELTVRLVTLEQPFLAWLNTALVQFVRPSISEFSGDSPSALPITAQLHPDIVSRRYRISPAHLHVVSGKALETLNWKVVEELPPDLLDAPTWLQAEGSTRILGLKHDIALRIRPDSVGALLDVRSRSQTPLKDLSNNADRIRLVFTEIDRVLLETYGDLARLSVEEDGLEEEDLRPEPLEDPRETIPLPGFKPYFEIEEETLTQDPEATDLAG